MVKVRLCGWRRTQLAAPRTQSSLGSAIPGKDRHAQRLCGFHVNIFEVLKSNLRVSGVKGLHVHSPSVLLPSLQLPHKSTASPAAARLCAPPPSSSLPSVISAPAAPRLSAPTFAVAAFPTRAPQAHSPGQAQLAHDTASSRQGPHVSQSCKTPDQKCAEGTERVPLHAGERTRPRGSPRDPRQPREAPDERPRSPDAS